MGKQKKRQTRMRIPKKHYNKTTMLETARHLFQKTGECCICQKPAAAMVYFPIDGNVKIFALCLKCYGQPFSVNERILTNIYRSGAYPEISMEPV